MPNEQRLPISKPAHNSSAAGREEAVRRSGPYWVTPHHACVTVGVSCLCYSCCKRMRLQHAVHGNNRTVTTTPARMPKTAAVAAAVWWVLTSLIVGGCFTSGSLLRSISARSAKGSVRPAAQQAAAAAACAEHRIRDAGKSEYTGISAHLPAGACCRC
jgi:hypothetical protein